MAHSLADYLRLLDDLRAAGFRLRAVRDYFAAPVPPPFVYLRHDVEHTPRRALAMAAGEADHGVRATYYFRCDIQGRFPAAVMRRLAELGHEIGFRYECVGRARGDIDAALKRFEAELATARGIVPIETIAARGTPLAPARRSDRARGIGPATLSLLGDAATIDCTHLLYLTDSGGHLGSPPAQHDHCGGAPPGPIVPHRLTAWLRAQGHQRVLLNCHPERWSWGLLARFNLGLRDRIEEQLGNR